MCVPECYKPKCESCKYKDSCKNCSYPWWEITVPTIKPYYPPITYTITNNITNTY